MFTLGLLYIFSYIFIVLSIFYLTFSYVPFQLITKLSTSSYFIFIQKYTNMKSLFLMLIFSLTGLPPVGLFFVKFNILAFVLYQTHIIIIVFLFLVFLSNMLYYIQIFNVKNFKSSPYSFVTPQIFTAWSTDFRSLKSSYTTYSYINFIVTVLGFILLTIFVYSDLMFLLNI